MAWDDRMLEQLPSGVRAYFPAVLTWKYVCVLFQDRTLGNSPSALQHNLIEVHSEEWLRRQLSYLGDCERHRYIQTCRSHICNSSN